MTSTEKESEPELELECPLCKDVFREPKTLGCLHSFCLECLEIYVERNHSNIGLKCPLCRTPFKYESQEHLAGLSTDSYLLNALNFHNPLKNSISEDGNQKLMCLDEENEATSYCLDCQEYYCETCTKVHQYLSHKILTIPDVVESEKQLLIDLINQVKPKEKELGKGINKCEEIIKQLEISSTTTQTQINQFFNKIRSKLDEKEQELLNKLEEIEKYKKKELEIQKEELKFGIESIIGSCQMIQHSISLSNVNNNNKSDNLRLLSMKKLYHSRLNYLSNNIWKIEPCHHSSIGFLIPKTEEESIYSSISNIGMIDECDISADKCLISRDENQQIICENEEFKFKIISYSKDGNQMKKGGNGKRFIIHIEEESKNMKREDNEKNECEIVDLNNGKYEVKIKVKNEGKYSIFVKFNGVDINSSPLQIEIFSKLKQRNYTRPKLVFGSNGSGNGQFHGPCGITINSKGNIFVCDERSHRIQIFDSKGKFVSTFGSQGNRNGNFHYPYGIAMNSRGDILVCDFSNNRIQIFDSKGKFLSILGSQGFGNSQYNGPYGICVDKNDSIFVSDFNNHRIQIFDFQGKFISKFGSQGNGDGQFINPRGIAVNSSGDIIVSDSNNHRIQIFDSQGKFISKFGSRGDGNGQFNGPYGICVDLNDNIYVCDMNNNRIQIFNSNGEYITQFRVTYPMDITIDHNTQNIIVSRNDNQVSVF